MFARLSQAARQNWQLLALTGLVGLVTAFVAHFGLRYHGSTTDELLPVSAARYIADNFPEALWSNHTTPRGPERLTAFLFAIVNELAGSTAAEFKGAHVLLALAWALVAVPIYALGRGLELGRGAALLIATVAVLNPYALFAATFLNTTLGYLTFAVLLYTMWRTTVRPGVAADLAVVIAFVLTVSARVSYAPLVLALIPAIGLASWRDRPAKQTVGGWIKRLPAGLWDQHRVLLLAAALGLAALAVKGRGGVTGGYGDDVAGASFDPSLQWENVKIVFARMAESLAFIPVAFALPWLVLQAARPRNRETAAFAVLGLATIVIYFFVFRIAVIEDRYSVVFAPVILLAFGCSLFRAEVSRLAVALTSAALVAIVLAVGRYPSDDPFSYLFAPGAQFFKRVLLSKLELALPAGDAHSLTIAALGFGAAAIGLAVCLRRGGKQRRTVTTLVAAAVLIYAVLGSGYAAKKFTDQVGQPSLGFNQLTYIDQIAGQREVGRLTVTPTNDPDRALRWRNAEYFNKSLTVSVAADTVSLGTCCPRKFRPPVVLKIDDDSGRLRVAQGPLPPFLLVPAGWLPWGLDWTPAASGYDTLRLEQLQADPKVAFASLGGTYPDGWIKPGRAERLRLFPGRNGQGRRCMFGNVEVATPQPPRPVRVTISGDGVRTVTEVGPGSGAAVRVRLGSEPVQDLRVDASPVGLLADGRRATARLGDLHIADC